MIENERKKEQYQQQQQKKKLQRRKNTSLSLNRLVCISKEDKMMRIRLKEADVLVQHEEWKYVAKKFWKKARADENSPFSLYWSVGSIDLAKVAAPNLGKYTKKLASTKRKELQRKEDTLKKEIRARKKRKNIKTKSEKTMSTFAFQHLERPVRIINMNGSAYLIDEESNKYYTYSTDHDAIMDLIREGGADSLLKAFKAKNKTVEGFYSSGKLDNPYFLDLYCGNIGFEEEPAVTGIIKKVTEHNIFLLNGNSKKFYILTKKHYNSLYKEHKTDNAVMEFVNKQGDKCVKVRIGNFSDTFFKEHQWPKLRAKRPSFISKPEKEKQNENSL